MTTTLGDQLDTESPLDTFLGWAEARGISLYPAQEEAILELYDDHHVFLTTPTGSGKSLVGLAAHHRSLSLGKRSVYTAPIKALVSEKYRALVAELGEERVGIATGDGSRNRDAPLLCCTQEILARIALHEPRTFHSAVIDEFHYYGDRDRGMAWQLPLLTLTDTRFLLMSATLGPTRALRDDLEARTGRNAVEVHRLDRPVPLHFRYVESKLDSAVQDLLGSKTPVYTVHFTQRAAAEHAQALMSTKLLEDADRAAIQAAVKGFRFDSPYGTALRRYVLHGVGVHHAGLLPKYRALVEQLAQRGMFKVICGTDTLGVGINVPIRTVLFTQLCKFDGEEVRHLSARHFHQIAGRAGRKGFDDEGLVVALAPEWVVENERLEAKIQAGEKKRNKVKKQKPPTRGYKHWDESTFEQLQAARPEDLDPVFEVDHGLVLEHLQRAETTLEDPMEALHALIDTSHVGQNAKARLHEEAELRLEQLVSAGVAVDHGPDALPRYTVQGDLHDDFSLHHALSLYLLHALDQLPSLPEPDQALAVLTQVESILEHPGAVIAAQENREKREKIASLKAEGVPYEERLEALEGITAPKPMAEWIYACFNDYKEHRPWLQHVPIRPKSVAREMAEQAASFSMYVKDLGIERAEGVLLRYLSQVYRTLLVGVPPQHRTDAVEDLIGYLRAMLGRVDDSLVTPFELGQENDDASEQQWASPRALRARIRNELLALVRALAAGDWEEASASVREPFDFEAALQPYLEERGPVRLDPRIREGWTTRFEVESPQRWRVQQILLDDEGDDDEDAGSRWSIDGWVDLSADPGGPLVVVESVGA